MELTSLGASPEHADINNRVFEASNSVEKEVALLRPRRRKFIHYTSLAGFYGIAETGRLRFTSAKSTNDPSEFLFGAEIVERGLQSLLDEEVGENRALIQSCKSELRTRDFQPFVFCMSETTDEEEELVGDLSQWRLYGSDGRGIAIVFDVTGTDSLIQLQRAASFPRRVVYGEEAGIDLVKTEVREFLVQLRAITQHNSVGPYMFSGLLGNRVFWLPSVIKHKAYRHEREVRLVRGDIGEHVGNPLVFYERNGVQRPSIERSIATLTGEAPNQRQQSPICRVVVGPSSDQSAIEDSIKHFLAARDWHIPISRSDIPYRAI